MLRHWRYINSLFGPSIIGKRIERMKTTRRRTLQTAKVKQSKEIGFCNPNYIFSAQKAHVLTHEKAHFTVSTVSVDRCNNAEQRCDLENICHSHIAASKICSIIIFRLGQSFNNSYRASNLGRTKISALSIVKWITNIRNVRFQPNQHKTVIMEFCSIFVVCWAGMLINAVEGLIIVCDMGNLCWSL